MSGNDSYQITNEYCEPVVDTQTINHEKWLDLRREGLGGSDAGAIMGMNEYRSPLAVYADKKKLVPDPPENDAMRFGTKMEPFIRTWFGEEFERKERRQIDVCADKHMYRSIEIPVMIANLDGIVEDPHRGVGGLEIKTAGSYQTPKWRDDQIPGSYYCQVQHYMAALGLLFFYVVCLLDRSLIWRLVPRNQDFIEKLKRGETDFWEKHVLQAQMPDPFDTQRDADILFGLYEKVQEREIVDLSHLGADLDRYVELGDQAKKIKSERTQIANDMKAALGEAKLGISESKKVTWSRFTKHQLKADLVKMRYPAVAEECTVEKQAQMLLVKELK